MSDQRSTFANRAALAALGEAAAGATGSVVSILALYPLDTTRTIMQVRAPPYDQPMPFIRLLLHIARTEGWGRLYRGLGSAISGAGLSWALYFAWNEFFKRWLLAAKRRRSGQSARLGAPEEMLAAAAAGILTTVIVNPIWVINTRLKLAAKRRQEKRDHNGSGNGQCKTNGHGNGQAAEEKEGPRGMVRGASQGGGEGGGASKGGVGALVELIRKEGVAGYLSGIVPAIVVLINPAIQLALYGRLRGALKRRTGNAPTPTQAFVMGAAAKGLAVLVTFPAQTVKLRMQAGMTQDQALDRERLVRALRGSKSVWEAVESVSSLWRGVGSKMCTSMLHSALMFAIVELFRVFNGSVAKSMRKRVAA